MSDIIVQVDPSPTIQVDIGSAANAAAAAASARAAEAAAARAELAASAEGGFGFPFASSIAALKAVSPAATAPYNEIYVSGYSGVGTRGGGHFQWREGADDSLALATPDDGYIILPNGGSLGTRGRWVRKVEDGKLRPFHYNASGNFVAGNFGGNLANTGTGTGLQANWAIANDDSSYLAKLWIAAMTYGMGIDLGPYGYMLAGDAKLPHITRPISIDGVSAAHTILAMHPETHRGPAVVIRDTQGLDNDPSKFGGPRFAKCLILGRRKYLDNVTFVPEGSQHGLIVAERVDRHVIEEVTIESVRGWGACFAWTFEVDNAYIREWKHKGNRIRECGVRARFPGMEWFGWPTTESNNEGDMLGWQVVFSYGCNMRFNKREANKSETHKTFFGGMSHGWSNVLEAGEDGIDYAEESLNVLDGEIYNHDFEGMTLNVSREGQFLWELRNSAIIPVTVPTGQTVPLRSLEAGSRLLEVELPPLPTRELQTGDVTTQEGSPDLLIYWPDHGFSRRDFVTFDLLSGTTRSVTPVDFNGILPRGEGQISRVLDADNIYVRFSRGLANETGPVDLSAVPANQRTLKRSYGLVGSINDTARFSSLGFDRRVGDLIYGQRMPNDPSAGLAVGGSEIGGTYNVRYLRDSFNIVQILAPLTQIPDSVDEVLLPAGRVITCGDGAVGPRFNRFKGNASNGANGFWIRHGEFNTIDVPLQTTGIDIKMDETVRGPNFYTASGPEGDPDLYTYDLHPNVAHLLRAPGSTSSIFVPHWSMRRILGNHPHNNSDSMVFWRLFVSPTPVSITDNGFAARPDFLNIMPLRPGVPVDFDYEVSLRLSQAPSTPSGRNKASWKVRFSGYYAGTGLPVIEEINGDPALVAVASAVGAGLPPDFAGPVLGTTTSAANARLFLVPVEDVISGNASIDIRVAGPQAVRVIARATVTRDLTGSLQ